MAAVGSKHGGSNGDYNGASTEKGRIEGNVAMSDDDNRRMGVNICETERMYEEWTAVARKMEVTPPSEHDTTASDIQVGVVLQRSHLSPAIGMCEASFDSSNGPPKTLG
ncbi:unnamed protein product [Lactuca saligna]|uniref:Uncharacterized protein n=1 Tax=Lactuca saligna TaxID=75948 RepID=A0AA36DWB0_LACSI|nr:unnamed protein product [Lactuca saligna]